jgi:hypothetical protein
VVISKTSTASTPPSLWQWPNMLALDAAWIAVLWQQWMGRTTGAAAWVLGLSVWLVYTADRWLDTRKLPAQRLLTNRHRISHHWQHILIPLWIVVLLADVLIAIAGLSTIQLQNGLVLLGICLSYTLAVYRHLRIPKELLVALIFTAGTVLFQIGQIPQSTLWISAFGLFLLVYANCTMIAARERTIDLNMGRSSMMLQYPNSLRWARGGLILLGIIGLALSATHSTHYLLFTICATGMLLLGKHASQLPPETFRVITDTILLLPLLTLF